MYLTIYLINSYVELCHSIYCTASTGKLCTRSSPQLYSHKWLYCTQMAKDFKDFILTISLI